MTVNYFLKCPVCGTITRMRTPAGYIYKTPVRVHCGECNTLLSGEFISDNDKSKAYYVPNNCESVEAQAFDYFGEASGDLLSHKLIKLHVEGDDIFLPPLDKFSPVFGFMTSVDEEDGTRFLDFACHISSLTESWDDHRIKYDLYLSERHQLLAKKYSDDAARYGCDLSSDADVLEYVYRSLFYDVGGIFKKKELVQLFRTINHHMSHIVPSLLRQFISELQENNRLKLVQEKMFGLLDDYQRIAKFLHPALSAMYYRDAAEIDKSMLGISTCSFEDIKHFYQNTFEVLVEYSDIIIGLDNIENRGNFNTFDDTWNMKVYREQKKGNRINKLHSSEFFVRTFALPTTSSSLRNAIGHSDYKYTGAEQEISYPEKTGSAVILTSHLLDVAMECCSMMRSMYVLSFIVYEILRCNLRAADKPMPMHPLIYKGAKTQSRCPCGSNKKYKNCCLPIVNNLVGSAADLDYPQKSDFGPAHFEFKG